MTTAEQILLQMMMQYAEASAKWNSQQNDMDRAFLKGEFRSWLKNETEELKDGSTAED